MEFKSVATGFCLLEAPRTDARGVWFTDIVLGGVRCLRSNGHVDSWLVGRQLMGGLAINEDGTLICSGPGGLIWLNADTGTIGPLLDKIEGASIGGINDIFPDGRGGLFFGTVDHPAIKEGRPFGPSAMYHLTADLRVTCIRENMKFANGIGISADGSRLYFNDSSVGTYAYDLSSDGTVGKGSLLATSEDGDGLAVDAEGGVWVAGIGSGTLTRVMPDGHVDRQIPVPGGHVTALCFGGADLRDVYVTTTGADASAAIMTGAPPKSLTGTLYHARSDVAGVPTGRTRFNLAVR